MGDIKFIVNKDKRIVICKLLNCRDIPWNRISKYVSGGYWYEDMDVKQIYTGVARCSAEDEWDEEYGKKLALARAKRRRARDINRELNKFCDKIERQIRDLRHYGIHELPSIDDI